MDAKIKELLMALVGALSEVPEEERIDAINDVREAIHEVSPLKHHPVDFVRWTRAEGVEANRYNPNRVAPPEMRLLAHSVMANGYTMPIVTHGGGTELIDGQLRRLASQIVDGFHRSRVGHEIPEIRQSVHGRLPVTKIRAERSDEASRIAATVEHNRARGEHRIESMSEIVRMLYQAGWRDEKIREELGMDSDEVRRLKQITGLAELFSDREFSRAWEPT